MAKVTFTTPIGVARYPRITSPDTTGDYADNKYKTDVVFSDADLKTVRDQIVAFAKSALPDVKSPKLPIGEHKDKETGDVVTYVRFKSARKPIVVDAKRNRLPDGVEVGGGSKIRVGGTLNAYNKGGSKGINIYLNAVQVVELQTGFNVKDFDEYDGDDAFVVEVAEDAKSEFDLKTGYKSPLEKKVATQLEQSGVKFVYEGVKLEYKIPARKAKYTPDFCFNRPIVIETKGWFRTAAERQKMCLVKADNPHLDIRFIFQNANKPIYKGSPTTYAMWATENGFLWADRGTVPEAWIEELNGKENNS